jgi:uncharacterized protein YkwD
MAAVKTSADPVLDAEEQQLCHLVNDFRKAHGRAPLKVGVALSRSSAWMSDDMARNDDFDHTDSEGRSVVARLKAFGYGGPTSGENIAGGSSGAAGTIEQWESSPPHRANLLNAKFKVMGVARAHSGDSMLGWYWTADFGGTVGRTIDV